jgi:hypothetical protein
VLRRPPALLVGLVLVLVPAAALAQDPSASPEPWGAACAVPASPVPQATPDCGPVQGGVPTAVLEVAGETYRIELTAPGAREGAYAILTDDSAATIPNGQIVRDDPGPNAPWSWHIDPATLEWAEVTTEACDGRPTQIEDGVLAGDRFCPWSAELLWIEHDPDAPSRGWTASGARLPVEASGGSSREDRTFARRLLLPAGSYTLRWTTDDLLDPTVSGCPATVQLLGHDGTPAPGSGTPYPVIQPDDTGSLTWPDLPDGWYDLFLSLDCGWAASFDRTGSSAS